MNRKSWQVLIVMCVLVLVLSTGDPLSAQDSLVYTLTISMDPPEGGSTNPAVGDHTYVDDTTVVLSASPTPDSDWRFSHWTCVDANDANVLDKHDDGSFSVDMNEHITCTATFTDEYYLIVFHLPGRGTVTKTPDEDSYPVGTTVTLTVESNSGWEFTGWGGSNADMVEDDNGVHKVTMGSKDIALIAGFSFDPLGIVFDNQDWMGEAEVVAAIEDRRLVDVVLPGSHDAGTYSFDGSSDLTLLEPLPPIFTDVEKVDSILGLDALGFIVNWAKTQNLNIYNQLKLGVRYFDLRFMKKTEDGIPYIYHGQLLGDNSRDDVLGEVKAFLEETNADGKDKEIIILDFRYWEKMDEISHRAFANKILEDFRHKMIPNAYKDRTLGEIWDLPNHPQLVVRYDVHEEWFADPADYDLFWPTSSPGMCIPWAETETESTLEDWLIAYMNCACCENNEPNADRCECTAINNFTDCACNAANLDEDCYFDTKFFVLQGILTPGADTIMRCGLSKYIYKWLADHWLYCGTVGAIPCGIALEVALICPENIWEDNPISIEDMAKGDTDPGNITPEILDKIAGWWANCQYRSRDNMNILLVDFVEADGGKVVEVAKDINLGVYNDPPAFTKLPELTGNDGEGSLIELSTIFSDTDSCDHHVASIDWGDETDLEKAAVVPSQTVGEYSVQSSHVYADNDTYAVKVCIQDGPRPLNSENGNLPYHYSETCHNMSIVVDNVLPTVDAGSDRTIYEADTYSLDPATFNDKGTLDTHEATINWDDRRPPELSTIVDGEVSEFPTGPPGLTAGLDGTVDGSYTYGDNGLYNVEVCVNDDDNIIEGGDPVCDIVAVTVNNVDPTVLLDKSAALQFADGSAYLARRGIEQTFNSEASDIGTDDLTFAWTFPPSALGASTIYYYDSISPDPEHSPHGNRPITISEITKITFTAPGVYVVTIDIHDDDEGHVMDSLPMLMTDSRGCTAVRPTWSHQYTDPGQQTIDDLRLQGYLDLIRFASAYFDDSNLLTLDDAAAIFNANGSGVDLLKQYTLAAWLNFASGGVLWDQTIPKINRPFNEVIGDIDAVLLDPTSTKKDLLDAQWDALKINGMNLAESSCNDPGTP